MVVDIQNRSIIYNLDKRGHEKQRKMDSNATVTNVDFKIENK